MSALPLPLLFALAVETSSSITFRYIPLFSRARAARDEQLKKKLHWALDQDTGSPFSVARQPPTSCDVAVVVSR